MSWMRASGSIANPNELESSRTRFRASSIVQEDARLRRLHAEDDVLGHRHHRDEHEVLVHHPEPARDRVLRRMEGHRLALDEDLPLVGLVQPVEDVHQRRLAGAVLAEQRVHLAAREVEVDVVVREDARKLLHDPAHLQDGGRGGHWAGILWLRRERGERGREADAFRSVALARSESALADSDLRRPWPPLVS